VNPPPKNLTDTRFGTPAKIKEALTALSRSVEAVCGPEAKLRLNLILHPGSAPAPFLSESTEGLRKGADARGAALLKGKPTRLELDKLSGRSVAILPLTSRGKVLGLLEVIAPSKLIDSSWPTLKRLAEQGGLSLKMLEETVALQRQADTSHLLARLAHDLVRSRSISKAVDDVARVIFQTFRTPVAAWAVKADLTRLTLQSDYGFSAQASSQIQTNLRSFRRLRAEGAEARTRLVDAMARYAHLEQTTVIDAGDAVIVIGAESPEISAAARFLQPMLRDVLRRLGSLAQADLRNERLDLGISWTAHELRGPLTGTRAVIDLLLQTADEESRTQHLLKRSREDLDRMAALVDGALRVTMTEQSLSPRSTSLSRVIRDAINICRTERPQAEIVLRGKADVVLQVDPPHLTGAIANVLRNSVWHSPPSSPVEIDVVVRPTTVQLRVMDRGPRVSGVDKEMIFDPFGRGESERAVGRGKGLGLFIARRVIEGHGGTIKVGSSSSGAMFVIDLPLTQERGQASAS
jgi:K+-sensing histidine kinase KdpD